MTPTFVFTAARTCADRFTCSSSRALAGFAVLVSALVLSGCATPPPPQPAPAVPSLEQFMADGAKARQEGSPARERETYHAAARAYPASKEPWQRLSESYFQAGDYGHAILAAQEVAQRDPADELATGVLAVSGLRVSTSALVTLRQQQKLNTDTRAQAEDVVKSLRELLGEPVLVPKPAEPVATPVPARKPVRKPATVAPAAASTTAPAPTKPVPAAAPAAPAAVAAPAPKPATTPAAATAAPATTSTAAPTAKANPFDKLK